MPVDMCLFMRLLKQVLNIALDFFLNYAKMTLKQFLAEIYFPENDCFVNLSDLSKMSVKKQMKYFYVPLDHAICMESSGFTRTVKYKND